MPGTVDAAPMKIVFVARRLGYGGAERQLALLARGLRGALFSVPELGFVSLRKGSFAWAPRAEQQSP